jgi:uncharacterized protein (TIGR00288 family)
MPHAALLIDFDNVTMGIRSDLTKELKNLLNSDIIKGKVAVQRAYADWRRYPQYIVPLAESSVDLIFAPAYGSAKKNATDIRLAIDALELVFTRPEIGTFILLSGDSDFSSLVLKLKEYGKYVVGVGIRESASDLLVQNCDEYYSYSALTGLTRAGDEAPTVSEDPWELVDVAIRQMADNDDVMRSDRLKQVLLELDPNFDEKALGFTKFNKFLQEAGNRGVLSLRKQENGQFEIGPAESPRRPRQASDEEEEEKRGRRRRGGRGRRGGREERERAEPEARAEPETPSEPELHAASETRAEPDVHREPEPAPAAEPVIAAQAPEAPEAAAPAARVRRGREARAAAVEPVGNDLHAAYALLNRALQDAMRASGDAVRDSDVKRRLLELDPQWDESNLGFSKFSRFLRRAHDDEVVTLRKLDNGNYEVVAGAAEPEEQDQRGRGRQRGRRAEAEPATAPTGQAEPKPAGATKDGSPVTQATAPAEAVAAKRVAQPIGLRRGSRGRGAAPSAPPPLFEGQTLRPASVARPAAAAQAADGAAPPQSTSPAWFPSDRTQAINHLAGYRGVGQKSAEALVEAFSADALFGALVGERERVRAVLGPKRSDTLLSAFDAERAQREAGGRGRTQAGGGAARKAAGKTAGAKPAAKSAAKKGGARKAASKQAAPAAEQPAKKPTRRGRRGGRKKAAGGK